jgi:hypothetical protein
VTGIVSPGGGRLAAPTFRTLVRAMVVERKRKLVGVSVSREG